MADRRNRIALADVVGYLRTAQLYALTTLAGILVMALMTVATAPFKPAAGASEGTTAARPHRDRPSQPAHVVGLSLGGAVAHTLLARHADVLDRVIIDGAGVLPSWGNGPYLLFIAAIAPFLHTQAAIGALSRSVGQIPESDQAELRVASRLAFLKSLVDARGTRASRTEVRAACPTLLVAGEKETAVRRSNAALAAVMPRAVARYVPGLGHGWLGTRMELHLDMVEAWLTMEESAPGLVAEGPSPAAMSALLRGLRDAE